MTTYCSIQDLDSLLEGFVSRYYGSHIDDADDITIGTQFSADQTLSFSQANEWLSGITHIKSLPIATQSDGNYPYHVRMLQGNLMIYTRLKNKHYGEFNDGTPGWINVFLSRAKDIYSDIRQQNVVFDEDITQGESGIHFGTFVTKTGTANWYNNWENGVYKGSDYPRVYSIVIDGTTDGNVIGSATFKWSRDGGISFAAIQQTTGTQWIDLEDGIKFRWGAVGTTASQLGYGDRYDFKVVPLNVPVKGGGVRYVTFKRG